MKHLPALDGLRAIFARGDAITFDRARDGSILVIVRRDGRIIDAHAEPSPAEVAADAIQSLQGASP